MRGDAFEDRRKPHTQTSANEVKGIKRMRIFTENMTPIRFISPSPLSQLAPFFLAVNARHQRQGLCARMNLPRSTYQKESPRAAYSRFSCMLLPVSTCLYLAVSCKLHSRCSSTLKEEEEAEEVSSGRAHGKRTVSRRPSATKTLVSRHRKSERSSS